jgi:hypothetical protein
LSARYFSGLRKSPEFSAFSAAFLRELRVQSFDMDKKQNLNAEIAENTAEVGENIWSFASRITS